MMCQNADEDFVYIYQDGGVRRSEATDWLDTWHLLSPHSLTFTPDGVPHVAVAERSLPGDDDENASEDDNASDDDNDNPDDDATDGDTPNNDDDNDNDSNGCGC